MGTRLEISTFLCTCVQHNATYVLHRYSGTAGTFRFLPLLWNGLSVWWRLLRARLYYWLSLLRFVEENWYFASFLIIVMSLSNVRFSVYDT